MLERGERIGPYTIIAPIGSGGMGQVYRAHDERLARDVAIKVLPDSLSHDEKARRRFEREAKTVAARSHTHIVAIYDPTIGRLSGKERAARASRIVIPPATPRISGTRPTPRRIHPTACPAEQPLA